MKHTSISYFFLFLIFTIKVISKEKTTKVIGVVELIRHGARTPSTFMEASAKLYFGARKAQLTINGYRQHILLGRYLRRQYVHGDKEKLLSFNLKPEEIKVFSSPRQRTIFSATAHIMGLYPKSIPKIIFGHKHFKNNDQPPIKKYKMHKTDGKELKIHVFNYRNDYIFHTLKCHRRGSSKKLKQTMKIQRIFMVSEEEISSAVLDILEKYNFMFSNRNSFPSIEEYKAFQKNYKKKKFKRSFFKKLVAFIRPFKYHHNSYKKLTPKSLKTIEKFLLNKWYKTRINDSQELRLGVSAQFKEIINFFDKRVKNENKEKILIFSGHDTNLVNFISNVLDPEYLKEKINNSLEAIQDFTFLVPPLASSIILELHQSIKDKNKYYINIIYNGQRINKEKFRQKVKYYEDSNGLLDFKNFRSLLNSRVDDSYKSLVCGKRLVVK